MIEWEPNEGEEVDDAHRDEMARDAVKAAKESVQGFGMVASGNTAVLAVDGGDGVVEVFDCLVRREAEVEVPETGEAIPIAFGVMEWAEIGAALRFYIEKGVKGASLSRADALKCLREIDRVMRGSEEPAAPDDVL
jgi:hypothetical protein